MKHTLAAILVLVFAGGAAWGQGNVQTKTDVEYAVHDGVSLVGDLYLPKSGSLHRAMVFIHGGFFAVGSRAGYGISWGPYLAERGYVVFAVDYRLSKQNQPTWPQALLHCQAAVQYLRGNAAALGVDPDRIGVAGDSAGGSLAAMVAVTQDIPRFANRYPNDRYSSVSTKVKVVVPVYGMFDMMAQQRYMSELPNNRRQMEQFIGGEPNQMPGAYFESSPLSYIREAAMSLGSVATPNPGTKIPWFLAWGVDDHVVPADSQSVVFVQALRDAGASVTAVAVPRTGHYWFTYSPLTGKKGEPECGEATPSRFTCSGPTPNDFIVLQLLDFLAHNL